jgi:hypothetical protein
LPVGPTRGPADAHPGQQPTAVDHRCPGEPRVTRGAGPVDPFEADEAGPDPPQGRGRLPTFRGQVPEGLLQLNELVGGSRPGRHAR